MNKNKALRLSIIILSMLMISISSQARRSARPWRNKRLTMRVCYQCYEQKATLFMHCLVSKKLKQYHREWCRRIRLQLSLLQGNVAACDKLINTYRQTNFIYPQKNQPYDSCDACFHNANMLSYYCSGGGKKKNVCKQANKCSTALYQVYRHYPIVPVESIGEVNHG